MSATRSVWRIRRKSARITIPFLAASILLISADLRAERVGFEFQGMLLGGSSGTYTLFGISVPRDAPVSGTFSYDTTSAGSEIEPGVLSFQQRIEGGYTLDINNGEIQLSVSDYAVTVGDDFQSQTQPEPIDFFSIDYSRFPPATEPPVLVNGSLWSGSTVFVKLQLDWAADTFEEPDEPKLTSDRPLTPDPGVSAFVGSSFTPRLFSVDMVSPIAPPVGDYNHDGMVGPEDYIEWRRGFDGSGEAFQYADGNNDGEVDAADYVVWRSMLGTSAAAAPSASQVPEPTGSSALIALAFTFLAFADRYRSILWRG